jgi:hypothetical protein
MQIVKKGDAGLAITPAEINLAPVDSAEKVHEASIHILEETAVGVYLVHKLLDPPKLADHRARLGSTDVTMEIVEDIFHLRTGVDNAGAPLLQFRK